MMMRSALYYVDQHACLDFYSAISLKQQSTDRHVPPLGHIPAFEQVYIKTKFGPSILLDTVPGKLQDIIMCWTHSW